MQIEESKQKGLYQKYNITKTSGKPLDPNFYAIVLRVDGGRYVDACREGALAFAFAIRPHNKTLYEDIYAKVIELIKDEVRREKELPRNN